MPKKENIRAMFDDIAPTYDKLNHILSLGIDRIWRKKAVRILLKDSPEKILDIACGTGDSSIALAKAGAKSVVGVDISEGMLKVAVQKVQSLGYTNISFQVGDALSLDFEDGTMDAAMIAFGIRNFEDRPSCVREIKRVLRPGGKLLILELSVPQSGFVRFFYNLYFLNILPFIGKLLSGNRAAYTYLPLSVLHFPKPGDFMHMLRECGFTKVVHKPLCLGLCRIFVASTDPVLDAPGTEGDLCARFRQNPKHHDSQDTEGVKMKTGHGSISSWIKAARPKTLFVSAAPVVTAVAVALGKGETFSWLPACICLVFALLAQVISNFVNDYGDFAKGSDGEDRIGPKRMVASGLISPESMKAGIAVTAAAAALLGLSLIHWGGWGLLPVGLAVFAGAYAYSAGPWPLSYHGLGDVAVLLFYGLVPVIFTYFVICGSFVYDVCLAGLAVGLVADELLLVNNYRDAGQDRIHGKRTSVVLFGEGFARAAFLLNPIAAAALGFCFVERSRLWCCCACVFVACSTLLWKKFRTAEGAALNRLLALASMLSVMYALMVLLCSVV